MFNVQPATPYRELKTAGRVLRNVGDIAQNATRVVANTALMPLNAIRALRGRETSWVPSYHAQRMTLRQSLATQARRLEPARAVEEPPPSNEMLPPGEVKEPRAEAEARRLDVVRQVEQAPESLLNSSGAPAPRDRAEIRLRHVQSVLTDMGCDAAARELANQPDRLSEHGHYKEVIDPKFPDSPFMSGIELEPKGRELLAAYYARKYGASIEITHTSHNLTVLCEMLPRLIAADRLKAPGDMRCAHYFGSGHGVAAIYIRESGEEAILFFDSNSLSGCMFGEGLAEACRRSLPGKPISVYEHFEKIQRDEHSCWSHAMKTCVTLTRRNRDESGNLGDFMIPSLIAELQGRRMEIGAPEGVIAVRALPEIAKMAQSRLLVAEHAGAELDTQLRDSKHGVTLRTFLEQHTYKAQNSHQQPTQVLDYSRQKGQRYAEIVQIEAWSERIGLVVGAEAWGGPQQTEFANRMKHLIRRADVSRQ